MTVLVLFSAFITCRGKPLLRLVALVFALNFRQLGRGGGGEEREIERDRERERQRERETERERQTERERERERFPRFLHPLNKSTT